MSQSGVRPGTLMAGPNNRTYLYNGYDMIPVQVARNDSTGEYRVLDGGNWVAPQEMGQRMAQEIESQRHFLPGSIPMDQPGGGGRSFINRAARNIPQSAANLAGDLGDVIMHPIQTGKAMANTVRGGMEKLMSPVLGPGPNEPYFDALVDFYKDRYGGGNALNTIESDPLGFLSDLSVLAGGGSALAKSASRGARVAGATGAADTLESVARAAKGVSSATDPLAVAGAAVGIPGGAAIRALNDGKSIPEGMYLHALGPSNRTFPRPEQRLQLARTGLDERIPITESGFNKLWQQVHKSDSNLDKLIDVLAQQGATVDPDTVAANARASALQRFRTVAPEAHENAIGRIIDNFENSYGGSPMSPVDAQDLKQNTYRVLGDWAYRNQNPAAGVFAEQELARGLKDAIAQLAPEAEAINRRTGNLLELSDPLLAAAHRRRSPVGPGTTVPSSIGAQLGGGPGAMLGAVAGQGARSPGLLSRLAIALDSPHPWLWEAGWRAPLTASRFLQGQVPGLMGQ